MSMNEWAENEIEIACREELGETDDEEWNDEEWDYRCGCYRSALKAYKSLLEDDHSEMSFSITTSILERLMHNKPLTAVEDTKDSWNFIYHKDDGTKVYQCKRMSSFFKNVHQDGNVDYDDIDRLLCYDIDNEYGPYRCGTIRSIINEMFPITCPYYPNTRPIKVFVEEFLVDSKNGDYDTQGILYAVVPGERSDDVIQINRYFKDDGISDKMVEITEKEYKKLMQIYLKSITREAKND